jgi:DNA-binding response OmpR family regulator
MTDRVRVFGDLHIYPITQRATLKDKWIDLTACEYKLLVVLSTYPGRTFDRAELLTEIQDCEFVGYERNIDTHVKNLRAKLGESSRSPRWIFTVHGLGYRFGYPSEWNK